MEEIREYKGWQDVPASLIPLETYKVLSGMRGVRFLGNPSFISVFIPQQEKLEAPDYWEAHWFSKCSGIKSFRFCKKSLAEFFKSHYNTRIVTLIDPRNITGLKMVRLLEFIPRGFVEMKGEHLLFIEKRRM